MNAPSDRDLKSESTILPTLIEQVAHASTEPGVYLMKDTHNRILYVGKARNLKKRLKSYVTKRSLADPKTSVLMGQVVAIETTVTHTEKEALILESNLIKRHRPRYNVVLKDDKRYPSLRLNRMHPYPNLNIVRKIQDDGALYFGPYASALAVRQTLKFIHKTFKLRKCRTKTFINRSRPCLNYQMGLCLGPCCLDVSPGVYNEIVNEVIAFLKGRTPALIRKVKREMLAASEEQAYEKAAVLRDKMTALEKTLEKQVSVSTDFKDRDAFGAVDDQGMLVITLMRVRGGFLMGGRHFKFQQTIGSPSDQLGLFLRQYYDGGAGIPSEIIVSHLPPEHALVEEYLSEKRGSRVAIMSPQRGEKRRLMEMALQNASLELREHSAQLHDQMEILKRLQAKLRLQRVPRRIECFDNSNLQGSDPVSAMVVFEDGQPLSSAYRRYKMTSLGKPDDYANMMEVIRRRFAKGDSSGPFPDLLLVDGGKGQINSAISELIALDLHGSFDVAGIAKKDVSRGEPQDKIFMAGRANAIVFGRDGDLLLFLQRVRDEAHRWAITFQRGRRRKRALTSRLDLIPGIGPQRRNLLLKHFESLADIKAASPEALSSLPGISKRLAETIAKVLALDLS
jgi:excinuclease ABC subunit C